MHDFQDCLEFSHSVSDNPVWLECYRQFFPTMTVCVDHREDGDHQRAGVDRSVTLANAKQYLIDEKVRRKDYGDILLEHISNNRTGALGWVCKPLLCDFIGYLILPRGKCYLFPVVSLQSAWLRNGEQWIRRHREVIAKNPGYETISVAVPTKEVFNAVLSAQIAEFDPQ